MPAKRGLVPAITRVERHRAASRCVDEDANPRYRRLPREFEARTGVPILLNTSFNESEPIVMSPEHAIETFKKTRIDVLVLGNYVVLAMPRRTRRGSDSVATAHE